MVLVEFFSNLPINNIITSLYNEVDKVFFLGYPPSMVEPYTSRIGEFIQKYQEKEAEIQFIDIDRNSIKAIVETLDRIIKSCAESEVYIDLTGGSELMLVGAGIVAERFSGRVQLHKYDLRDGLVYDCDGDGQTVRTGSSKLTIKDNVELLGGSVAEKEQSPVNRWNITDNLYRDINKMWTICRYNPSYWNAQIGAIESLFANGAGNGLYFSASRKQCEKARIATGQRSIIRQLNHAGILTDLVSTPDEVKFKFKNQEVFDCLAKQGNLLEAKIYASAKRIMLDGKAAFNDVKSGVKIYWNAQAHDGVANEIDDILLAGFKTIFISCKNGSVKTEELYKLNAVAERFGGKYMEKLLLLSGEEVDGSVSSFIRRAERLNIRVIKNFKEYSNEEIDKLLLELATNK